MNENIILIDDLGGVVVPNDLSASEAERIQRILASTAELDKAHTIEVEHKREAALGSLMTEIGLHKPMTKSEMKRRYKYSADFYCNRDVGRNDPCPCGSNKKYKKCCKRKRHNNVVEGLNAVKNGSSTNG